MLVSLPTSSGESWSWSWLSGWAPCWRRKEAFSNSPRSTARKRGVCPRGVRHSTEPGPEPGQQDTSMFDHTSASLKGFCVTVKQHRSSIKRVGTFECELQDGLVALSRGFVERSPTSAVCLWKLVSLPDTQILQELLLTWREGWTERCQSSVIWHTWPSPQS